jgi:leucyl aminopeptidase
MKQSLVLATVLLGAAAHAATTDYASAVLATARANAGVSNETVWVSLDKADLSSAKAKGIPLPAAAMSDDKTALFEVHPADLPLLSEFMHDQFHRCGGFLAFRSKSAAMSAMKASAASNGGGYTLDQSAVVTPLLARVTEANIKGTIDGLAAFNNRYYTADTGVQAARWIQARWQDIAAKIPGATVELITHEGWPQPSVVMTIPGSDKADEIVVLGGHEDSINGWGNQEARAPGADDNASGIAVLTESARVLAESGFRPRRTIQYMAYAAEEVGLRGSQDIAERWAGKKVVAVIQYDMTNYKGNDEEIFLLSDYTDPALNDFLGQLIDTYLGVKRGVTECGYACSDHASWNKQGVPAAIAFEASFDGMNHNIHTDHDDMAHSGGNAHHSVSFAKLAAAFAVEAAKTAAPALRTASR